MMEKTTHKRSINCTLRAASLIYKCTRAMAISSLNFHRRLALLLVLLLVILLASSLPLASAGRCNKSDKRALLAIKAALNNPYHLSSWDNISACCDWTALECDPDTGRVVELTIFADSDLSGAIPDAVGDLPFLRTLMLHKLPKLVGGVPPAIAKLKNLRMLIVSWTNISGPVPSFLSQLPQLDLLDLSFNNLSGPIPDSLGDAPLLTSIDISRNKLTGTLPPSLFHNVTSGAYLRLSHNNLSGEVPASYAKVPFLQIDLSRNKFQGDASFLFGRSKPAQHIDLSRNSFDFDFSKVEIPEGDLVEVDVNHNKLFGSIPAEIAGASNLQQFNVSYNRLCGEIPTGGNLDRFDQYCYLHNKCLCGTPLPACK